MGTPVEAPNSLLSNSILKITDLLCEGPISGFALNSGIYGSDPLTSTYYDNVPVRNLDGSYNFNVSGDGYSFYYTLGTPNQGPMAGFQNVENIVPINSDTLLSDPTVGIGIPKTVTASFNTTTYPDANSVRVTVRVPALFSQNDVGDINGYNIDWAVDISVNGGAFVTVVEDTIVGKCTSAYLKTRTVVLPKTVTASSFYQWTVRVRRTSNDIYSASTSNSIYVESISLISSSSYNYPNSALVGTRLSAAQFSAIPTRAYVIQGMLVSVPSGYTPTTYNTDGTITPAVYPTVWDGTWVTGKWTDNPAWAFNDILTNPRYGLGDYISQDSVDKWSLYQIAQYCDELIDNGLGDGKLEPRFTCNITMGSQDDSYNVLQNLSSTFRGMLYYANGSISATQTSDKKPSYLYTNANVVKGQFSYADTAKTTRATVALVKWTDPSNFYRESVEYIEDTAGILRYGYVEKQVTAFACTSKGQAYRIGQWILQTERLLTETVSFQVGFEGIYSRPGDVFSVYDNFRNNRSQGGRLLGFNTARNTITLDRPVVIESGLSYVFSAITPKRVLNDPNDVTGSSEIDLIRNAQMEAYTVTNLPTSGTSTITLSQGFTSSLANGYPWILSASGGGNVFQNSTLYQCITLSESEPGLISVLGIEYNTGINQFVENDYSVASNPINSGNFSPISAPSALQLQLVTGLLVNGTFYSYLNLNWGNTTGTNFSHYVVSGQTSDGAWVLLDSPVNNQSNFNTTITGATGYVNVMVGAVSDGGVYSSFISGNYFIPPVNPLGGPAPLSGIELSWYQDPTYLTTGGSPTGYLSTYAGFHWTVPLAANGFPVPRAQYTSGYRFHALDVNTHANLIAPATISGAQNTNYAISGINKIPGNHRAFIAYVETLDFYGNSASGASIVVDNPAPRPPVQSGFGAIDGGFSYSITPNPLDSDISGVYLWESDTIFTPTFGNVTYQTSNLAGTVNNEYQSSYNVWFSLTDTFSNTGCQIYGPILIDPLADLSGISTQIGIIRGFLGDLAGDLANEIARANDQAGTLTTEITTEQVVRTSGDYNLALSIQSVNAAMTGASGVNAAGILNTQAAIVTTSGALAAQNTALFAYTSGVSGFSYAGLTGEEYTRTTADGALSASITTLTATVTGIQASTTILADAYVISGRAVATYGFQLDANGKVVSMQAIAASGGGQATVGTIIFGGANLQSSTYIPGSAGWTIKAGGNVEFSSGSFRGTLVANAGTIGGNQIGPSNISSANYVPLLSGWAINSDGSVQFSSGVFRGSLYAAQGSIGGFTIDSNRLYAGTGIGFISLSSDGFLGIQVGANTGHHFALFETTSFLWSQWNFNQSTIGASVLIDNAGVASFNVFPSGAGISATLNNTVGLDVSSGGLLRVGDSSFYNKGTALMATDSSLYVGNIKNLASNAAAISAGLISGQLYRNGDILQIVH